MKISRISCTAGALFLPAVLAVNTTSSEGILSSGDVALGNWATAYAKATALVAQMTNEEKVTVITAGSVSGSVEWAALEFKDGMESVQGMHSSSLSLHS